MSLMEIKTLFEVGTYTTIYYTVIYGISFINQKVLISITVWGYSLFYCFVLIVYSRIFHIKLNFLYIVTKANYYSHIVALKFHLKSLKAIILSSKCFIFCFTFILFIVYNFPRTNIILDNFLYFIRIFQRH